MKISTACSSSSGTIDSQDLALSIENLSLSSSSYCCSVVDRVISDIDLLTLILICLPVKTLLVFKSVSKQWCSLISDPRFAVNNFRRLNPKITGLFFENQPTIVDGQYWYEVIYDFLLLDGSKFEQGCYGKEEVEGTNTTATGRGGGFKIPQRFDNDTKPGRYGSVGEYRFRISQSCNGLLCCNRETEIDGKMDGDSVGESISTFKTCIYNPTTRQYRYLPPSPFRDNASEIDNCLLDVLSISLAFDPIKSMDHHYQVICIWKYKPYFDDYWDESVHGKCYIEIYSSKSNSWRKLDSSYANPFSPLGTCKSTWSGVYWNGCLHWIADYNCVLSTYFDIEQEIFKPLPVSPNSSDQNKYNVMYFGECGGHLYLIELESCFTQFNIWKMEIDYSGWKSIYRLDLERLVALYPGNDPLECPNTIWICRKVLFLEEDEAESLSKLVVAVSENHTFPDQTCKVVSYDLKEMSATEIHTFPETYNYLQTTYNGSFWYYLHHYVESLVCV